MDQKTPEYLVISTAILQNVANYLVTKPYMEVAQLLAELRTAKPVDAHENSLEQEK